MRELHFYLYQVIKPVYKYSNSRQSKQIHSDEVNKIIFKLPMISDIKKIAHFVNFEKINQQAYAIENL